jgi:hypothetical protein
VSARLTTAAPPAPSPPARRLPARRWRDWRLLLGLLLVLGSTVAGARLVAAADDTVGVWAADTELVPGTPLQADDLRLVPVLLETDENPYLAGPVPEGYVLVRPVGAGELLPASAVLPADEVSSSARLVSVAVDPAGLPGRLRRGAVVDVWEVPDTVTGPTQPAQMLAASVPVVEVPAADGGFTAATLATVVVSVDAGTASATEEQVARLVTASAAGRAVLTAAPVGR